MKKRIFVGCGLPLLIVVGLCWWGMKALKAADPPKERYETVDRGVVELKVTETGTIDALKKVEIKSKVAGRVSRLLVDEGYTVKQGQLLAEIDPTEINSQVAQIKAQLDGAKARYEQAQKNSGYQADQTISSIKQAEENLKTARAKLKVAEEQSGAQPRLTSSAVTQAEAAVKTSRQSLELLQKSSHPQAIVQAQSGYDDAKAAEENSRSNLARQQKLLDKGFVSQQVVDAAKADLAGATARMQQAKKKLELIDEQNRLEIASAESRVKQDEAALETAKANSIQISVMRHELDVARYSCAQAEAAYKVALAGRIQNKMREDEVREAKASVVQLENSLRENQVHQYDTTLFATMPGVVTKRYIEQGELVTSGVSTFSSGTPVMQIADLSHMLVKMSVNEVDVQKIKVGQPVEISIDAAKGSQFKGRVTRRAPAAIGSATGQDNQSQAAASGATSVVRFAVEVTIDNPDGRLKPGMSAKCSIIIDRKENVLRLPNDGIEGEGSSPTVQLVGSGVKDGKPADVYTPKKVTAGLRGDTHVEILEGLKQGDRVKPAAFKGPKRQAIELNVNAD